MNKIDYHRLFTIDVICKDLEIDMIKKNVWNHNAPVTIENLKLLTLSYIDFDGVFHNDGQMIVLDAVAESVVEIFTKLLDFEFPIASIKLMNEYNGDDNISMDYNNSSCFNARKITGGSEWSIHAYGAAIDINPIQNPYYKLNTILPNISKGYMNRNIIKFGMVEPIVEIFINNGFEDWGGNWQNVKGYVDYMHFALNNEKLKILANK